MSQEAINWIFLLSPLLLGGLVAAMNAGTVNDVTESAEATIRRWQSSTSARTGVFAKYLLNPPLWAIVRFCDWTDGFTHRGAKNGTRVAATLYLVGAWLLVLYAAVIVVVALVLLIVGIVVTAKILGGASESSDQRYSQRDARRAEDEEDVLDNVGLRGRNVYTGTNWFNEELKGRVDEEGNLYRGTNWFNEEKIGRIDGEGNIYKGTSWMNEEKVGRVDEEGTLFKGTNWFNEEKTGRIDEDGTVYKGTNWFNEEKQGRSGD